MYYYTWQHTKKCYHPLERSAEIFIPRVDLLLLGLCNSNGTLLNAISNSVNEEPIKMKQNHHLLKLRCFYFNAHSLKSKLTDLHDKLYNATYDVIGVSETWINSLLISDGGLDKKQIQGIQKRQKNRQIWGRGLYFRK